MKRKPKIVAEFMSLLAKIEKNKKWRDLILLKIKELEKQKAIVVSALPLTKEELKKVKEILKKELKGTVQIKQVMLRDVLKGVKNILNKKDSDAFIIEQKIKKDILGGIKIIIGSKVIDLSISGQLEQFKNKVKLLMKNE